MHEYSVCKAPKKLHNSGIQFEAIVLFYLLSILHQSHQFYLNILAFFLNTGVSLHENLMFCLVSCSLLAWQDVSGRLDIFSSVFECLAPELLFIMKLRRHGFLEHFHFILALSLGIAAYSSQFFGLLTMYICNHVFMSMKISSRALLFFSSSPAPL